MSMPNYRTYNQVKTLNEIMSKTFLCLTGGTMKGDIDFDCNKIIDIQGIHFCNNSFIGEGNSFDISTNEVVKVIQNSQENFKIDTDGNFYFKETNKLSFNDIYSSKQSVYLPTIHNNPISLERVSIFSDSNSHTLNEGNTHLLQFNATEINQLNLTISGTNNEEISPSLDISGQYVEIYLNVKFNKPHGNRTSSRIKFDISGVSGAPFIEEIDSREASGIGDYYITFGPHIFIPTEWNNTERFVFELHNQTTNGDNNVTLEYSKIIFKSRFL